MGSLMLKMGAIISTTSIAVLNVSDPVATGKDLGSLNAAQVLGIVAVSCVMGMVALYWQQRKTEVESRKAHSEHTEKLYKMIESATAASIQHADVMTTMVSTVGEMKAAIVECRKGRS